MFKESDEIVMSIFSRSYVFFFSSLHVQISWQRQTRRSNLGEGHVDNAVWNAVKYLLQLNVSHLVQPSLIPLILLNLIAFQAWGSQAVFSPVWIDLMSLTRWVWGSWPKPDLNDHKAIIINHTKLHPNLAFLS